MRIVTDIKQRNIEKKEKEDRLTTGEGNGVHVNSLNACWTCLIFDPFWIKSCWKLIQIIFQCINRMYVFGYLSGIGFDYYYYNVCAYV